ncbi:MAG: hypothetical protein JSV04_01805 [Candidatus Heimdallarchaeota archaeon]|nr:MAG: hypothetical protein JSV04_01805 [Candidatus Heimdallarchaeota archaeon]
MNTIELSDDIYDWQGEPEILSTSFYKITQNEPTKIIELSINSTKGIVILGPIEVVTDAIVYTDSHGAVGNTIKFSGTNLVIIGISITHLTNSLQKSDLKEEKTRHWKNQAESMISKLKSRIEDRNWCMDISLDDEEDFKYLIFGRRNFLLVGSEKKFVLLREKQISVREGEYKLVQIDPYNGILIAKRNKVLNIGGTSRNNLGSLLGELGVNIASSVLDQVLWD